MQSKGLAAASVASVTYGNDYAREYVCLGDIPFGINTAAIIACSIGVNEWQARGRGGDCEE